MLTAIMILLVIFQLKHFVADYPLQNQYMLGKFKREGWILPLTAHSAVHAAFTFLISITYFAFSPPSNTVGFIVLVCASLAYLDFAIHFCMDRLKAHPDLLGRYKALSGTEFMKLKADLEKVENDSTEDVAVMWMWRHKRRDILQQFQHNTYFWWCLGFDQMVHHLTDYAVIFALVYFTR